MTHLILLLLVVCGISIECGILAAAIAFFVLAILELNKWIIDNQLLKEGK